jgi:choline dehydrogenase-like flavoprotein
MIVNGLPTDDLVYDVCVVGTGPVGIAVMIECERHGLSVLALEAGGEKQQGFGWLERLGLSASSVHHAPLGVTTRCAFGGTSWAWSGGCITFDDIDFDDREHVAESGWPLAHEAVAPYYDDAARILQCSPSINWQPDGSKPEDRVLGETVFSISKQPKLAISYREHIARSQFIVLALNSRVTALNLSSDGTHVESLTVVSHGRTVTLRPQRIVLAAGGLKTTRLLLATQRRWPHHFGGPDGALGRYYMGHLAGSIASVAFRDPEPDALLPPRDGGVPERRLTISRAKQMSERLLNVAFWPNAALFFDPSHGDGVLSAAFLALAIPRIGNLVAGGGVRRSYLGSGPRQLGAHVRNIVRSPGATIAGLGQLLWNRIMSRPGLGARARDTGLGVYALQYHAETEPKWESRVCLSDKIDRFGVPELSINLMFSENDAASIVRSHDVLDKALRDAGMASIDYLDPPDRRATNVLSQARDGYHQLGTTRMGNDPSKSVVDKDCRVHGIGNLFVASSSVFPTSGHANPTLLATTLGVRLAEHLAGLIKKGCDLRGPSDAGQRVSPSASQPGTAP